MVTSISLGSFSTSNGKNILTGSQSGLDTKSLVDGLVQAKRIPATNLETTNKTLDKQLSAFSELKTLLTTFKTSVDTLRNAAGLDPSKNVFNYRTASITTSTGAAASSYVDISVQPGAAIQDFSITNVISLAQQTKQQTGDIVLADSTTANAVTGAAGFFTAGTVNLRAVDGTVGGIPITLNNGDSLQSVVNKFNAVKDRTGIQASILTVSTGSGTNTYKIIYSATKQGTTYGFDLGLTAPAVGAGVESDASGVLSQLAFGTTQFADNARFDLDGVTITRESNGISDLISGVTFNLKQKTAGVTVNAAISADTSIAQSAIQSFADAYNSFRLFAAKQSERGEDGLPTDDAVLALNRTFQTIVTSVGTEVSQIVGGLTSGALSQLSDVGLKLDDFAGDDENPATKNILTVDADKLSSALTAKFDQVRAVFENQMTSDNSNLITYKTSNNLLANTYTISIDRTNSLYSATYVDPSTGSSSTVSLNGTNLPGGGITLSGQDGTVFSGTQLIYAVAGDATINVNSTHGIADRLYNIFDSLLNTTDGALTNEVQGITDQETRNKTEITKIDDQLITYRDQLTQKYADLEAALSQANSLLTLLDAQANARNNNN